MVQTDGNDDPNIYSHLENECLYNGEWKYDVKKYGCTECIKRSHPANGKIWCNSPTNEAGSKCILTCNPGFIPVQKTLTTCLYKNETQEFLWDVEDYQLQCTESVALVVGGILASTEYTDTVEILAPGYKCKYLYVANYPHKIVGVSAGYTLGQNIVCGGGMMEYIECHRCVICNDCNNYLRKLTPNLRSEKEGARE